MTNFNCYYHHQRGMSAPLRFGEILILRTLIKNKTNKMKKFLLLLSCFLATWCSVQAANPQITSATYNESTSQFYVNCTSGNNLYIDVICMKTGPVLSKVNINTYKTIDLPITSRPGEYDLVLYANGTPCHDKKVTVTQYGHINNITNISTSSVTVNYSMFHAETDNYPKNSYLKIGDAKYYIKNVKNGSLKWTGLNLPTGKNTCKIYVDGVCKHTIDFIVTPPPTPYGHINNVYNISTKSVTVNYTMRNAKTSNSYLKIGNYTHDITNVENGSYPWSLNLTPGQYTCEIYVDGERKHTYPFTVHSSDMVKLTPMGNRLKIDFTLSSTGVNVKFRVHTYSLSGGKGESKEVVYGICDKYEGTYEVSVPYYTGYVGYAVELIKNGTSVNGASATAYNR